MRAHTETSVKLVAYELKACNILVSPWIDFAINCHSNALRHWQYVELMGIYLWFWRYMYYNLNYLSLYIFQLIFIVLLFDNQFRYFQRVHHGNPLIWKSKHQCCRHLYFDIVENEFVHRKKIRINCISFKNLMHLKYVEFLKDL